MAATIGLMATDEPDAASFLVSKGKHENKKEEVQISNGQTRKNFKLAVVRLTAANLKLKRPPCYRPIKGCHAALHISGGQS